MVTAADLGIHDPGAALERLTREARNGATPAHPISIELTKKKENKFADPLGFAWCEVFLSSLFLCYNEG